MHYQVVPKYQSSEAKLHKTEYTKQIEEVKPTIVFLSTYPPRECGIATFTQDLLNSSQRFLSPLVECKVAAINLSPLDTYNYPPEVAWEIDQNSISEHEAFAKTCNEDQSITGIIIQHEYGIFGGSEGGNLLRFMQQCQKPMLVTLHTALPQPSEKMYEVTAQIIALATTIVVLTHSSREIVMQLYPEAFGKIFVIPHGIHPSIFSSSQKFKEKLGLENRLVVTTFGLLSRGKGIEYALRSLPEVIKHYPSLIYLILGETHPVVRRQEGEKYRLELAELVISQRLENHVQFYDQYFTLPDLLAFLKATDIYLATSINPNQAVSGTLSYALGTGLAVISTEFAQAKEIVTQKTGRLVPLKDSVAIEHALLELLVNPKLLQKMHKNAYIMTRPMLWSSVAEKYISLLTRLVIPKLNLKHLYKMTDECGLFQFANESTPNPDFGYTLDDNARALSVSTWLYRKHPTQKLKNLLTIYLSFIKRCQAKDGSFINYLDYPNCQPTKQNTTEDLQDAHARALWGLSETISHLNLPFELREQATQLFLHSIQNKLPFTHLRAQAFAIKAFALVLPILSEKQDALKTSIETYAQSLLLALNENSVNSWRWFEKDLNYNNGLLPESLLIAGAVLENEQYTAAGIQTLQFLISKTFSTYYMPIGHTKWYENKQTRSEYDQQPEDPASMILALKTAYTLTHEKVYKILAIKCFSWFLGNNSVKLSLYNEKNGGCFDGLHPDRVNQNQGAESLVSYLMARVMIGEIHENTTQ
ncbi:glycosyltransferase family 4 protein [soil metagenome]